MVAFGCGEIKTEQEPLRLADLNGAVLKYQDSDGNTVTVEFEE